MSSLQLLANERSREALSHLQSLKPYDGWSLDSYTSSSSSSTNKMVMLTRRNIPLSSKGFLGIVHDIRGRGSGSGSDCIVGITKVVTGKKDVLMCRGVVLVNKDGSVVRESSQKEINVNVDTNHDDNGNSNSNNNSSSNKLKEAKKRHEEDQRRARQAIHRRNETDRVRDATNAVNAHLMRNNTNNANNNNNHVNNIDFDFGQMATTIVSTIQAFLTDEQTSNPIKISVALFLILTIHRILSSLKLILSTIILPILIIYAMANHPTQNSFDAKKELKRVLRGHHLPTGHEQKPKQDWLSQTISRVTASVAAEAATALGYQVEFWNVYGIFTFVTVDVPVMNMELYWIGVFGGWRYLYKREKVQAQQDQE